MPRLFLRNSFLAGCMLAGAPEAFAQCAGFGTAPAADTPAAEVVGLVGRGETRASGAPAWQPAALAQKLAGGADMRTLALSSAALLLADRTQIRMSANAELRLCDAQAERSLLELIAGRLWARTKRNPANLQLQTPAALAVVRGTDWDVQVEDGGRTTLTVLSGQVEFSNAYGRVDLGPAEQGVAVPGQAPTKRLLVNPRERVQWVAAYPDDPTRWEEFQRPGLAGPLAEVRADVQAGQWGRARERLLALVAKGEGGAAAELALADLEVADGQLDAAQARLEGAWQRTQDPRTAARRAELLMALDRGPEVRAWLDATRAAAPTSTELLLADADWQRLEGRAEAALALYREAVERAQGSGQEAAAQAGLGRALQERGDLHAGRLALARAVELAPDNAAYRGEQATAAAEALRLPEARVGFDAALALAGDDYVSLAGSGLAALKGGDAQAARTQFLKALVIEPRYAQAHIWLAVAEYQLGEPAAAFDALARARQVDPNDPIPWQIESILRNDGGEPESAIAAAREALARQPYLKSLNPLASDAQGSANLGKALGDFGLEHWARAYAQQSYYPLWAGSHFFMANRYESPFARRSEFHQGYLADPLAFGASEKQAPVLLSTLGEWVGGGSVERDGTRTIPVADLGHHGLTSVPFPIGWRVGIEGSGFFPRTGVLSDRMQSFDWRLGLGARPTDRLGLLLTHTEQRMRYYYPGGVDDVDGEGVRMDGVTHVPASRTDLGGSWRWSGDEQTWLTLHRASFVSETPLIDPFAGLYNYANRDADRGVKLRHTLQHGNLRFSAGWERGRVLSKFAREYSEVHAAADTRLGYDIPWAGVEGQHGPWTWQAQAFWPQLEVNERSYRYLWRTGAALNVPQLEDTGQARRLRPRLGVSYRFAPGRALHAAYIESLYTPSTYTLAPVAVGAIPIDYHYQTPGSLARKLALQFDWEFDPRSFGVAMASQQDISSIQYSNGDLLPLISVLYNDRIESLGPLIQMAQTSVDPYNGNPVFDRGRLQQLSLGYNRILTPRWSVLVGYIWSRSRSTGEWVTGNELPGFPRHSLALTSAWRHGGRDYTFTSLVYRSARFVTVFNGRREAPGWNLSVAHAFDSADRRWSVMGSVQTPLDGRTKPVFWLRARYRE